MKNTKHRIIITSILTALILPLSVLASPPPAIPVLIYGSVKINNAPAPTGTKVKALSGNIEIASFTLKEPGKYFMNISGNKISSGSIIKFRINEKDVADTEGKYRMVDANTVPNVKYDLAITTQANSGQTGGGGGASGGGGSSLPPSRGNILSSNGNTATITPNKPEKPNNDFPNDNSVLNENGEVKGAANINIKDGDIIQCQNSANPFAVYIVKIVNDKKYIRHIVSLQIFNHYKHLQWENLIQVDSLDSFSLSGWVRVNTGTGGNPGPGDKVYEINGDQTRHWIDMTAQEFLAHGGSEDAIYSINQGELDLYKEGPAVKLQ